MTNKHNHDATCSGLTRLPPSTSRWVVHSGEPLPARRRERRKLAHGSRPLLQQGGFAVCEPPQFSSLDFDLRFLSDGIIPQFTFRLLFVLLMCWQKSFLCWRSTLIWDDSFLRALIFFLWAFACPHYSHAYFLHISFNFLHCFFFFFALFISFSSAGYTLCEYECVSWCTKISLFLLSCHAFPF